ncbi:hypothetical protein MLD38_033085 [Melastoma candidum]|uniref:Uncharacterized protein n=1 Tax=Melastoma candidum TaxID=119954 RepID=A0ACB9M7G8_9MYRT|nr:hypothetical protein MLD38_033085 [Melastoma candidum]
MDLRSAKSSPSSSTIPFRSKKPLRSTSKAEADAGPASAEEPHISSNTPDKKVHFPGRAVNRGVALSVKDVREAAQSLRQSKRPGRHPSARKQIFPSIGLGKEVEEDSKPKRLSADRSSVLPEKLQMLGEFFDRFHDSIKLLRLKGSATTFTKICSSVERLTDRRFTHRHLAQLKFIMPEVICVEKIQSVDEHTSCMMANLRIELSAAMVKLCEKNNKDDSPINLKKLFRKRLLDFIRTHPGADDVPEEQLPEPFNYRKIDNGNHVGLSGGESTREAAGIQSAGGVSLSFRRHFSREKCDDNGNRDLLPSGVASQDAVLRGDEPNLSECPASEDHDSAVESVAFPVKSSQKEISSVNCENGSPGKAFSFASTPAKLVLTPARLLEATPALCTPKRCSMSPDDDDSSSKMTKLVRRPASTRSLIFETPLKQLSGEGDAQESGCLSYDEDLSDVLPMGLLQSIQEKEKRAMEERDPAISRAKRRREIIAGLPRLFNTIRYISTSRRQSVITKDELVYQIVASNSEMTDKKEVEEQLDLMKEIVPEWISEKVAMTGDVIICINKTSDPDVVRAMLVEAK